MTLTLDKEEALVLMDALQALVSAYVPEGYTTDRWADVLHGVATIQRKLEAPVPEEPS